MTIFLTIVILCSATYAAFASETPAEKLTQQHAELPDQFAGRDSMNGFKRGDFGNFEKDWKLVTVRYREDTKEMRFTYANDAAWSALKAASAFPKGAVFAKVGFVTHSDKLFESSVVPSGAKRFQFMVRDSEKFKATDGWGYALFNGNGKTFNGEPGNNSLACAACHRLAESRGFVFSQPLSFEPFVEKQADSNDLKGAPGTPLKLRQISRGKLPSQVARLIPERFKLIDELEGSIRENLFEGTLNEVSPFLAQATLKSNRPSALFNRRGDLFSLVYPERKLERCEGHKARLVLIRSIQRDSDSSNADGRLIKISDLCRD